MTVLRRIERLEAAAACQPDGQIGTLKRAVEACKAGRDHGITFVAMMRMCKDDDDYTPDTAQDREIGRLMEEFWKADELAAAKRWEGK